MLRLRELLRGAHAVRRCGVRAWAASGGTGPTESAQPHSRGSSSAAPGQAAAEAAVHAEQWTGGAVIGAYTPVTRELWMARAGRFSPNASQGVPPPVGKPVAVTEVTYPFTSDLEMYEMVRVGQVLEQPSERRSSKHLCACACAQSASMRSLATHALA